MAGSDYVTARDLDVLCAVGRVPFLTGPELGALFFAEPTHSSHSRMRRLRQLRHRELLISPPRIGSRGATLFALTIVGQTLCLARTEVSTHELTVFGGKRFPTPLTHFRLLAQSFITISQAIAGNPDLTLDAFFGEHFFKQPNHFDRLKTASGRRVPVIPDGLFILRRRVDGKRKFIFIEADTGTENLGRIARKIRAYEAYRSPAGSRAFEARYHAPPVFDVLFVTGGRTRANNLRRTVAALVPDARLSAYRFAVPQTILRPFDATEHRQYLFD